MRHLLSTVACAVVAGSLLVAGPAPLPNVPGSLKMAVIGDNGNGSHEQAEVAEQMAALCHRSDRPWADALGNQDGGARQRGGSVRRVHRSQAAAHRPVRASGNIGSRVATG